MREIIEIAVNDIKTAFIHVLHLIKKVKKNINMIRKKQKMYKNCPNRKPSNETCNTETKNKLDIIVVDIAKDIMVDIAEENVIESKHIAKEIA